MKAGVTIRTVLAALLVLACTGIYAKGSLLKNGGVPITIGMTPASAGPNSQVMLTVHLDQVAASDQPVAIGCSDAYAFTNLPSEIIVPAGYSSRSFYATTSGYYQGGFLLTATANSVTAWTWIEDFDQGGGGDGL